MGTTAVVNPKNAYREHSIDPFSWTVIALIAGLVGALYAQIIPDLASDWWNDSASSYGMLVPPIALYIAYLRRGITLAIPVQSDARGLWLISLACVVFLSGKLAGEFFLARVSIGLLLAGLAWTFWGFARFKTLFFPFVLLGTMVPLPAIVYNAVAAPLQLLASSFATHLAQMLGLSIYRDRNVIHLANSSLGVAEACSALHSLPSMLVAYLRLR